MNSIPKTRRASNYYYPSIMTQIITQSSRVYADFLFCIVRDLRSSKASTNSSKDIFKLDAIPRIVSKFGDRAPVSHLDQVAISTSVFSDKTESVNFKNVSLSIFDFLVKVVIIINKLLTFQSIIAYLQTTKHPVARMSVVDSTSHTYGKILHFIHLTALVRG